MNSPFRYKVTSINPDSIAVLSTIEEVQSFIENLDSSKIIIEKKLRS